MNDGNPSTSGHKTGENYTLGEGGGSLLMFRMPNSSRNTIDHAFPGERSNIPTIFLQESDILPMAHRFYFFCERRLKTLCLLRILLVTVTLAWSGLFVLPDIAIALVSQSPDSKISLPHPYTFPDTHMKKSLARGSLPLHAGGGGGFCCSAEGGKYSVLCGIKSTMRALHILIDVQRTSYQA